MDVILHLLDCIDYFGGIPQEMVIDQDRLMVVSENAGDIIYTKNFKYFIEETSLQMYVCRKADPESKGRVENLVGYVKKNHLSIRSFSSISESQDSVKLWLNRRANGKISQATKKIPLNEIENEWKALRPRVNSIFQKDMLLGREERTANDKAQVSVSTCNYVLPSHYKNKKA